MDFIGSCWKRLHFKSSRVSIRQKTPKLCFLYAHFVFFSFGCARISRKLSVRSQKCPVQMMYLTFRMPGKLLVSVQNSIKIGRDSTKFILKFVARLCRLLTSSPYRKKCSKTSETSSQSATSKSESRQWTCLLSIMPVRSEPAEHAYLCNAISESIAWFEAIFEDPSPWADCHH